VSTVEDIVSLVLSLLAIFVPVLAFVLLLVLGYAMFRLIRGIVRRRAAAAS
jgi:hypothetical protein